MVWKGVVLKILGLGVPELIVVVLIVAVIAATVFAVKGPSKQGDVTSGGFVQSEQGVCPGVSVSDLKGYKDLLDIGAITQEEYDAKKKEILGL